MSSVDEFKRKHIEKEIYVKYSFQNNEFKLLQIEVELKYIKNAYKIYVSDHRISVLTKSYQYNDDMYQKIISFLKNNRDYIKFYTENSFTYLNKSKIDYIYMNRIDYILFEFRGDQEQIKCTIYNINQFKKKYLYEKDYLKKKYINKIQKHRYDDEEIIYLKSYLHYLPEEILFDLNKLIYIY